MRLKKSNNTDEVVHAINLGGRSRWISEFKATLVYRGRSKTFRATQRNLVLQRHRQTDKERERQRERRNQATRT